MWQNLLRPSALFTKTSEVFAPYYLAGIRHDMRQTTPRAGTIDRYASPGASLSPPACRCGGGDRWSHEGAVWASPGGQPSGLACAAEGAAVPPPADPTGAHSKGPGQDTADWDFGVRGQSGPRRR